MLYRLHQATEPPVQTRRRIIDVSWLPWVVAALGLWLICAPWVLLPAMPTMTGPVGLRIDIAIGSASWTDWICGALIAILALVAGFRVPLLRWALPVLAAVVFAVPWFAGLLGPADLASPSSSVITGFVMLLMVLPGMGGFVWNSWLTGAAVFVLVFWPSWRSRKVVSKS